MQFETEQVIDEYGEDMDILNDVFLVLERDAPIRLEKLDLAIKAKDYSEIHLQAHTLKGSFRIFFATSLASQCEAIEKMGVQKSLQNASEILSEIENDYSQFSNQFRDFLNSNYKAAV